MSLDTNDGSRILAQSIPAGTGTADLYSPNPGRKAIISQIVICNVTAGAVNASVFAHASGNTKTTATALMYAKAIAANSTDLTLNFPDGLELLEAGTLGIQASAGASLTFTVLGQERDK